MKAFFSFFVFAFFILQPRSFAMKRSNLGLTRPCTILIQNHRNSGEKVKVAFTTRFKSKLECRQLATMHTKNFETDLVRAKRVHFIWNKRSPKFISKKPIRALKKLSKNQIPPSRRRARY